jgi:hypothetical protein
LTGEIINLSGGGHQLKVQVKMDSKLIYDWFFDTEIEIQNGLDEVFEWLGKS